MRNPERIPDFCNTLAELWKDKCPDWRFGQLIMNFTGGQDIFYVEDDLMLEAIKKYFDAM